MAVFVPSTMLVARSWRDQGLPPRLVGYAATVPMMEAHGLAPGDDEDADFTALNYAAAAALELWAPGDQRLVLAITTAARPTVPRGMTGEAAAEVGAVMVDDAGWSQVKAVFVDEPAAAPAVPLAQAALGDGSWLDAWDEPDMSRLVTDFDLLWYVPDELDGLIVQGRP